MYHASYLPPDYSEGSNDRPKAAKAAEQLERLARQQAADGAAELNRLAAEVAENLELELYVKRGHLLLIDLPAPDRVPLELNRNDGATAGVNGLLKGLDQLHAEQPDLAYAYIMAGDSIPDAVIDAWAAGLITVRGFLNPANGERGLAIAIPTADDQADAA